MIINTYKLIVWRTKWAVCMTLTNNVNLVKLPLCGLPEIAVELQKPSDDDSVTLFWSINDYRITQQPPESSWLDAVPCLRSSLRNISKDKPNLIMT